jgi:hypothetical protein
MDNHSIFVHQKQNLAYSVNPKKHEQKLLFMKSKE